MQMSLRDVKLSAAIVFTALSVVLRCEAALAQVSEQDCAALEVVLTGTGAVAELDAVDRDDLARRIERHGPALGLTVSTTRLQALALREDDPDLMALLMADLPALQAAHAQCLVSTAEADGEGSAAQASGGAVVRRAGPPRRARIEMGNDTIPFSWLALLGLAAVILSMGLVIWGFVFSETRHRRRARRFVCDLPARVSIEGAAEVAVQVTDISRLGCRLTPGTLGPPGTRVDLQVAGLALPGRVMWQNRHFCGLAFATPLARPEIDHLLASDRDGGAGVLAAA